MKTRNKVTKIVHTKKNASETLCGVNLSKKDYEDTTSKVTCENCKKIK